MNLNILVHNINLYIDKLYENEQNLNNIVSYCNLLNNKLHCSLCPYHETKPQKLFSFKKYLICKFCLTNKKVMRFFTNIVYNKQCDNCNSIERHCYQYKNNMIICNFCFTKYDLVTSNFSKILHYEKLYENSYFYLYPQMIKIKQIEVEDTDINLGLFDLNHDKNIKSNNNFIEEIFNLNSLEFIISNDIQFHFDIENLSALVEIKESKNILPILSLNDKKEKEKNEFYTFINILKTSNNYSQIYILFKINGKYHFEISNINLIKYLQIKNAYEYDEYCIICKKNICNKHKNKLKIN